MTEGVRSWVRNGCKYWALRTKDAEIVAVMELPSGFAPNTPLSVAEAFTPYIPPMSAKFEIYVIKKGLARFLGYLEGEQLARAHLAFQNALQHAFGR